MISFVRSNQSANNINSPNTIDIPKNVIQNTIKNNIKFNKIKFASLFLSEHYW